MSVSVEMLRLEKERYPTIVVPKNRARDIFLAEERMDCSVHEHLA